MCAQNNLLNLIQFFYKAPKHNKSPLKGLMYQKFPE